MFFFLAMYYTWNFLVLLAGFVNFGGVWRQIAVLLAVLVSKIARVDYPKEWYAFSLFCKEL